MTMTDIKRQTTIDSKNDTNGKELATVWTLGDAVEVVCGIGGVMSLLHMSVLQHWMARPYNELPPLHWKIKYNVTIN